MRIFKNNTIFIRKDELRQLILIGTELGSWYSIPMDSKDPVLFKIRSAGELYEYAKKNGTPQAKPTGIVIPEEKLQKRFQG